MSSQGSLANLLPYFLIPLSDLGYTSSVLSFKKAWCCMGGRLGAHCMAMAFIDV
jgi:hypothetical protein